MSKAFFLFLVVFVLIIGVYLKMNYQLVQLTPDQIAQLDSQGFLNSSILLSDDAGMSHDAKVFFYFASYAVVRE